MAGELFGPAAPADVSFEDMLACVDREIKMRRRVYPRWVQDKKLTKATADAEILRMRAVRLRLIRWHALVLSYMSIDHGDDLSSMLARADEHERALHARYPESI